MSFDVFLSHNSKDKPTVRLLGDLLKKRGLSVWLDEWELAPGQPWQEALEDAISIANSAAVLVGTESIGPWQQPEMRAALSQFVNKGLPVIPVLLPNAPSYVDLPLFLQSFTWVDFRDGFSQEVLDRLVWGITSSKLRKEKAIPLGDKGGSEDLCANAERSLGMNADWMQDHLRLEPEEWNLCRLGSKLKNNLEDAKFTLADLMGKEARMGVMTPSYLKLEIADTTARILSFQQELDEHLRSCRECCQ